LNPVRDTKQERASKMSNWIHIKFGESTKEPTKPIFDLYGTLSDVVITLKKMNAKKPFKIKSTFREKEC